MSVHSVSKDGFHEYTGLPFAAGGYYTEQSWFRHSKAELVGSVSFDECDRYFVIAIHGKDEQGKFIRVSGSSYMYCDLASAEASLELIMEHLAAERSTGFSPAPQIQEKHGLAERLMDKLIGIFVAPILWSFAFLAELKDSRRATHRGR